MLVDNVAAWVLDKLYESCDLPRVIDYAIGLRYSYVVVEGMKGRALGVAITPIEDIQGSKIRPSLIPSVKSLLDMLSSLNSLDKVMGVSLLNALSTYMLWCMKYVSRVKVYENYSFNSLIHRFREPIVVVGNMGPLVKRLKELGIKDIVVLERNPCVRGGIAFSDIYASRIIPRAKTVIITGATLVNDTIDYILNLVSNEAEVMLVGPTASVHPEPILTSTKVTYIASMRPIDIDSIVKVIKLGGGRWDFSKYCREYIAMLEI